jgi:hypothetical protein
VGTTIRGYSVDRKALVQPGVTKSHLTLALHRRVVSKQDVFLAEGISQFLLDLPMSTTALPAGFQHTPHPPFLEAIRGTVQEYLEARHLTPLKLLLMGPPMAGALNGVGLSLATCLESRPLNDPVTAVTKHWKGCQEIRGGGAALVDVTGPLLLVVSGIAAEGFDSPQRNGLTVSGRRH